MELIPRSRLLIRGEGEFNNTIKLTGGEWERGRKSDYGKTFGEKLDCLKTSFQPWIALLWIITDCWLITCLMLVVIFSSDWEIAEAGLFLQNSTVILNDCKEDSQYWCFFFFYKLSIKDSQWWLMNWEGKLTVKSFYDLRQRESDECVETLEYAVEN